MRKSGRVFVLYWGLISLVYAITALGSSQTSMADFASGQSYFASLTIPRLLLTLVSTVLAPLWILIPFKMYYEAVVTQNAGTHTPPTLADVRVCKTCSARIPSNAKYCMNCGTRQDYVDV